jgi:hypothetical protein
MAEIRLADGTIRLQNEWLSADDIKARIKEKMDAGDMKFAELAAALEELNKAMENTRRMEVRLVLPKQDYEKLRKRGGDDDNESVRKAVLAFIEAAASKPSAPPEERPAPAVAKKSASAAPAPPEKPAKVRIVTCSKCNRKMEIPAGEAPAELECDFCGTSILLQEEKEPAAPPEPETKPEPKEPDDADELSESGIRHKDHFIG